MNETRCTCGAGHATFGACMRAKGFRIGYCKSHLGQDFTRQKAWDSELDLYRSARAQGIQPDTTHLEHTRHALDTSDAMGEAYVA